MKKKTTSFLSVLVLVLTLAVFVKFTGTVKSLADEPTENEAVDIVHTTLPTVAPTTTPTTLIDLSALTSVSIPTIVDASSLDNKIRDWVTRKNPTTTTTTVPASEAAGTTVPHSGEDVSGGEDESGEDASSKKNETKTSTTKKVTTTVKLMTVPVLDNTSYTGVVEDPLVAYSERIAALEATSDETTAVAAVTQSEDEQQPESGLDIAVKVIIAVCAMIIVTCALTGFFAWRNKRQLNDDETAQSVMQSAEDSYGVSMARRTEPTTGTMSPPPQKGSGWLSDNADDSDRIPQQSAANTKKTAANLYETAQRNRAQSYAPTVQLSEPQFYEKTEKTPYTRQTPGESSAQPQPTNPNNVQRGARSEINFEPEQINKTEIADSPENGGDMLFTPTKVSDAELDGDDEFSMPLPDIKRNHGSTSGFDDVLSGRDE